MSNGDGEMKDVIAKFSGKRSIVREDGQRTSVSLENVFWDSFKTIAKLKGKTVNQLVDEVDKEKFKIGTNLSSAIRVYVLNHYMENKGNDPTANRDNPTAPLRAQ